MLRRIAFVAALGLLAAKDAPGPVNVHFYTSDNVLVYATAYAGGSLDAPVILLFHQARSSKSEYLPIVPRLTALGYNVLAVDQRSGGSLYTPPNETVAHLGKSAPDATALPDLEAAVDFARQLFPKAPLYAWGSSYSAGLVFALAAKRAGDVAAVFAFSPDEYFDDKHFVRAAAARISVPVFIDSAADPDEEGAAREIYDAVGSREKVDYVPRHGIHGSSTLRYDRDPKGAAENWVAVTRFLQRIDRAK